MMHASKQYRPLIFISLILVILGSLFLWIRRPNSEALAPLDNNKISVMASFYPVYYFASQISLPNINLQNITPAGSEPHDYEPTPQQLTQLERSQMLILNGSGFEPWATRLTPQLENLQVSVVDSSQGIAGTDTDPHVWLSPKLAQTQVQNITQALIAADPTHTTNYETQSQALLQELQNLDQEFTEGLSQCRQQTFVTSHAAFGHLADSYDLEQLSISGLSPEEEPSTRSLAELTTLVRANNIKYIFFETLVSPKLSETLALETGAQTLVLDPLEGLSQNQIEAGENYFTVMRSNLANLQLALECQ